MYRTPQELVQIGIKDFPLFDPGTDFHYSNTNTVLLGLVLEQVTGKPLGELCTANGSSSRSASEAILAALRGHSMQDRSSELPRTPFLETVWKLKMVSISWSHESLQNGAKWRSFRRLAPSKYAPANPSS